MDESWELSKKAILLQKSEALNTQVLSIFRKVLRFGMGSTFFIGKLLNCNFAAYDLNVFICEIT